MDGNTQSRAGSSLLGEAKADSQLANRANSKEPIESVDFARGSWNGDNPQKY